MLIRLLGGALRRQEPVAADVAAALKRADDDESAGRLDQAAAAYRAALTADPGNAICWNNLGWVLQRLERFDDALEAYQQAVALDPALIIARNNVGTIYRLRGELDAARAEYETALQTSPRDAMTHLNLGTVFLKQAEAESALTHFREAVSCAPQMEEAFRALLLALNFLPGVDPAEAYAHYRAWGARCAARIRPRRRESAALPGPDRHPERRLRIGYVSPDFRQHAMAGFIEQALANHDAATVDVFCYDNSPASDAVTARLRGYRTTWRAIRQLDDAAAAALVERDRIDILVDLAGHTVGERLEMFASRPAPVQASLLGYLNTTGLEAIDYRICDVWSDPPGVAERFHVERLWRLPGSFWCFLPPADAPAVAALPALAANHITFGSFNNFSKLNHSVTSAWAELLRRVTGSRLIVAAVPDGACRERFLQRFASSGIDPSRIELVGRQPQAAFRELHNRADIALDPFPYAGGATSCESLWMGVPVVTLAGTFGFARSGASILQSLGLEELVAEDIEEYVNCAAHLAGNLPALQQLRSNMRERICRSELADGPRFAAKLETAYRGMWREHCGMMGVEAVKPGR